MDKSIRRRLNDFNALRQTEDITERLQFTPNYIPAVEDFVKAEKDNRITLIQSVRGAVSDLSQYVQNFLKEQKDNGKQVYIPMIYNYQEDQFKGITICNNMRYTIENSSTIAIDYNPNSEGSKFDYGIVLFNETMIKSKDIKVLNPNLNIQDPIYDWMRGQKDDAELEKSIFDKILINIMAQEKIGLELKYVPRPDKDGKPQVSTLSPLSAIEFGMIYASRMPFTIINPKEVKEQTKFEDQLGVFKSYSKVALMLDQIYNS